jgi:hypothetical protein
VTGCSQSATIRITEGTSLTYPSQHHDMAVLPLAHNWQNGFDVDIGKEVRLKGFLNKRDCAVTLRQFFHRTNYGCNTHKSEYRLVVIATELNVYLH